MVMDRIGRKWTILVGCVLTAAGIGVQVGSSDWKEFLAGRLVNGSPARRKELLVRANNL